MPPTDSSVTRCTLMSNQAWSCQGCSVCKGLHGHEQPHFHAQKTQLPVRGLIWAGVR